MSRSGLEDIIFIRFYGRRISSKTIGRSYYILFSACNKLIYFLPCHTRVRNGNRGKHYVDL